MPTNGFLKSDWRGEAQALLRANRLHEARDLCRQKCQLDQHDADAWFLLGAINGKLGDSKVAGDCFQNVIALRPEQAEAYFNLGISLRDQQRLEEAAEAFRAALQYKLDYVEAHSAFGYVLTALGRLPAAEEHFRRAIALNPQFSDAFTNLGNLLRAQGRNDEAIASYRRAIEARPDHIDAMINLASLLAKLTRIEEAIEWDRRILAIRPDFAEVHYHLGNLMVGVGRLEKAVECFRAAQRIRPDFTEATGTEAQVLQRLGRFDESYQCIRPALESGKKSTAIVVALTAIAKRFDRQEESLSLTEEMLRQNALRNEERQQLQFAAGKLCDDLGYYPRAFAHYRQANELYQVHFARETHTKMIDASIAFFQPDRVRRMPRTRILSDLPVFIVGMPRSGTSLVEQILASHPRILGAGELNDINQFANGIQARLGAELQYPACLSGMSPEMLDSLAGEYHAKLRSLDDKAVRVTDKMPHNFLHLGLIAMLFPRARIIYTVRDPMDTCLSIYFQQFNDLHAYARDLSDLGFYYRSHEKLMRHWRGVLDLPLLEVPYEQLVNDPRTWIPRLVDFCSVEWNEQCMQFHETRRTVNTPSNEQVRERMYTRSVGRWRHYERQLEPLGRALEQYG